MKLFMIFACARSGHHAVIQWIASQHNNIKHDNNITLENNILVPKYKNQEPTEIYGKGEDYIVNVENFPFTTWINWSHIPQIINAKPFQPILVIRRFKNWLASALTRIPENMASIPIYQEHLTIAGNSLKPIPNLITIRFDDWFQNKEYRQYLTTQLHIPFTDAGKDIVPYYGKGSSFDGRKYNHHATNMNVLNRYTQYSTNQIYNQYLEQYKDLNDMSEQLFNSKPYETT